MIKKPRLKLKMHSKVAKMRRLLNSRVHKLIFLVCCLCINILYLSIRWNKLSAQDMSETKAHTLHAVEQKDRVPETMPGDDTSPQVHCQDATIHTQPGAKDGPLTFQPLGERTFALSAYYDERAQPDVYIRILAIQPRSFKQPIYCLVSAGSGGDAQLHAVEAETYVFNENHGRPYGGVFLSCPVKGVVSMRPCSVMLSEEPHQGRSLVTLPLLHISSLPPPQYSSEFGVCIPALHGGITVPMLVDFVETTLQLGANHFYFYRYDGDSTQEFASPAIQRVTQYYEEKGLATVYSWHLPVQDKHLWYHGQVLAIHHCLYQNMWTHKYLAFNDIDEFLVPYKHETWTSLLSELDTGQYSGFKFYSAFLEPNSSKPPMALHNSQRTGHNSMLTKCMVKPERIFEMGIHHISKWMPEKWKPRVVDPELALIHHHKQCRSFLAVKGFTCNSLVWDETMLRYKEELLQQFSEAMSELHET